MLINNQTATKTSRASNHWISSSMRSQDATLERLRVDRQLEEALTHGPDPLHLAEVIGLDEKTAMALRGLRTGTTGTGSRALGIALRKRTWAGLTRLGGGASRSLREAAGTHPRLQESSRRC